MPGRPTDTWIADALCNLLDVDPDIWFPERRASAEAKRAKTFCRVCPVRLACLESALNHPTTVGIWGGLDEVDRSRLYQRKAS